MKTLGFGHFPPGEGWSASVLSGCQITEMSDSSTFLRAVLASWSQTAASSESGPKSSASSFLDPFCSCTSRTSHLLLFIIRWSYYLFIVSSSLTSAELWRSSSTWWRLCVSVCGCVSATGCVFLSLCWSFTSKNFVEILHQGSVVVQSFYFMSLDWTLSDGVQILLSHLGWSSTSTTESSWKRFLSPSDRKTV